MNIEIEYDIDKEEISEFIGSCRGATYFHSPSWMNILVRAFPRFRGGWITARDGKSLRGVMPFIRIDRGAVFSIWSMPFGTYGTPLCERESVRLALVDRFSQIAGSSRCAEAVASLFEIDGGDGSMIGKAVVDRNECSLIMLDGDFTEYRSKRLSRKKRQICNGCEKDGVEIRLIEKDEDLSIFYDIYFSGSTGWGGVHPYPREFFRELFKRRDEGILFWGAFVEGRMLGGHIDIYYKSMAQAWQAGISDESHSAGIACYLVYRAVEEAYKREVKVFNLGSSCGDSGMLFFKRSMGGIEHIYPELRIRKKWWKWLTRK
ncbi:MAG: GNAT family N-acetyltransferase [Candidatus Krumholzibacteriota bacterium]|nr:GNAT family N-acetyltransferase [Candidatus Krumholzibacteriota bacterium]